MANLLAMSLSFLPTSLRYWLNFELNSWLNASPVMTVAHTLTRLALEGLALSVALGVLCLLALPALPLARRLSATLRFRALASAYWLAALLPLLAIGWPQAGLASHTAATAGSVAGSVVGSVAGAGTAVQIGSGVALLVGLLWMGLSLAFAMRLLAQSIRMSAVRRSALPWLEGQPLTLGSLPALACPVALADGVDTPCLVGVLRPMILIPRRLPEQITPRQLAAVLAHEAAHLRRLDLWVNLAQKLVLLAFPLHPMLYLLDRWLCRERELACDEMVLGLRHEPIDYASSLVDVAAFSLNRPAVSLSFGLVRSRSELAARIERILRPQPRLHPVLAVLLTVALAAGAGTLTTEALKHLPTLAFAPLQAAPAGLSEPTRLAAAGPVVGETTLRPAQKIETAYRIPPAERFPARLLRAASSMRGTGVASGARTMKGSVDRGPASAALAAMPVAARRNARWAPQIAEPMAGQMAEASTEYAVVVVMTAVTTTTDASPDRLLAGDEERSAPTAEAFGEAPITPQPPSGASLRRSATSFYFTVVTTTLRLTPAQRARISPQWLARQL